MPTTIKIFLLTYLVLLTACTVQEKTWESVSPVFISEQAKKHIESTRVVVSIDQDSRLGIPVLGQRTSHQYFGVIGKLAESATVRFEKDLSADHRRLLRGVDKAAFGFDTGAKFRDATDKSLRAIDWLKVKTVVNRYDVPISDIKNLVQSQDEDALLFVDNRFLMSFDFRSITVFSHVTLYAHNEKLMEIAKKAKPYEDPPTLYKNLFIHEFHYENRYTTAEDALSGWSAKDGEMVKNAIMASINDLTNQLASDLSFITVAK